MNESVCERCKFTARIQNSANITQHQRDSTYNIHTCNADLERQHELITSSEDGNILNTSLLML